MSAVSEGSLYLRSCANHLKFLQESLGCKVLNVLFIFELYSHISENAVEWNTYNI